MSESTKAEAPKLMFPSYPDEDKVWHDAACHCHAIEYKIFYPPLHKAGDASDATADAAATASPFIMSCNCSICTKNGYVLVYPLREEVKWTKGYDTIKNYRFATKTKDHMFCPNCGSTIGIDFNNTIPGGDRIAINTRMLKDFDFDKIQFTKGQGRQRLNPEFNEQFA